MANIAESVLDEYGDELLSYEKVVSFAPSMKNGISIIILFLSSRPYVGELPHIFRGIQVHYRIIGKVDGADNDKSKDSKDPRAKHDPISDKHPPITAKQRNLIIDTLKRSNIVKNWVTGLARAYDVDLHSDEGKKYYDREVKAAAKRMLRGVEGIE